MYNPNKLYVKCNSCNFILLRMLLFSFFCIGFANANAISIRRVSLLIEDSDKIQVSGDSLAYVDSLWHGGADPTVLWNSVKKKFYMYYTQRRADLKGEGWAEGSKIGIAVSTDWHNWRYFGTCKGERLEDPVEKDYSLWAPSVLYHGRKFHMYVTYVPGITGRFGRGVSYIKHYTSKDGENWTFESFIPLSSDDCIDPCVYRVGKLWLMAYKDKAHTWLAESRDLYHWKVRGPIIEDIRHEAPFYWKQKGRHFMIVDAWKNGARVYESPDGMINWKYITRFYAGHPAVYKIKDKTYLIYHLHDTEYPRRTAIYIKEVVIGKDGLPKTSDFIK